MSDLTIVQPIPANVPEPTVARESVDWHRIYTTPEGRAALAVFVGLCVGFLPFLRAVVGRWLEPESLYSHGPLVPLMSAYVVYERWPRLRTMPAKGAAWAIVPILLVTYATWFASRSVQPTVNSVLFLLSIPAIVLFVGGWRWLVATSGPILYLAFGLPLWDGLVDRVTQPLQMLSTDMSVRILDLCGLHPMRVDVTTIYLDHYQFTVAAACSGAKLTLSLLAFACFFILLNRGRWYSSAALLALLVPIAVLINGLRIALVGVFGNAYGADAGAFFHDYGAYGVLIVSFLLLGQLTRLLGFKQ